MLLAEELVLVAVDPGSGRHPLGTRDQINACLAGLLVAELVLDGTVVPGPGKATVVAASSAARPSSPVLAAAADVVAEKGPKVKAVFSHMSRGLDQRLGHGTWDALTASLVESGVLAAGDGGLLTRHAVVDTAARDEIVGRLRTAAAGDDVLDARTALVLSMTGPAHLLELVAPERAGRKHARRRIDHALQSSQLQPIGELVRKLLAEAAAAATAGAVAASS